MRKRLRVTFRGFTSSKPLQKHIADLADRLDDLYDGIVGCHVVVEAANTKHRHGNPFRARVDLSIPGRSICAESEHAERTNAMSVYEALSDAFDRAERQLVGYRDVLKDHHA